MSEVFKLKRLLKRLDSVKGSGTSVVTLILPPGSTLHLSVQKLTDELGAASNIKSRVNRQATEDAISATQTRLKTYSRCPENGLVIFAGEVADTDGKPRRIVIDFEPYRPIQTSKYVCADTFYLDPLHDLLNIHEAYGFIVIDGKCLYVATLCGETKIINVKYYVDLPKKHNKGGQSAARFGRTYQEKRQNYVTKSAEFIKDVFIKNDELTVAGIFVAGPAELKTKLVEAATFDPRMKKIVLDVLDTSYGGEMGLSEAIRLAASTLNGVPLIQETALLARYYDEIARDTGKYIFGFKQTFDALKEGLIQDLIVWNELNAIIEIPSEIPDKLEKIEFIDWICEHVSEFGATLYFVSDRTSEGTQFVTGFGGIGGILRYKVETTTYDIEEIVAAAVTTDSPKFEEEEEFDFM